MEVRRRLIRADHGNVVRKLGVQGRSGAFSGRPAFDFHGGDLAERVHAGVGTARDGSDDQPG